jgi:Phosphate-induced protein 1 conserved region
MIFAGTDLRVARSINFSGTRLGTSIGPGTTELIVNTMLETKQFVYDANAIFIVMLGSDIKESVATGFNQCTDYCGYHSSGFTKDGKKFYYAVVGAPANCPACIPLSGEPNDPAFDAASVIVHELAETVTSPDEDAWMNSQSLEIADKCYVSFSTTVEFWKLVEMDTSSRGLGVLEYPDSKAIFHSGYMG